MSQNLISLRCITGVEGSFHFDSAMVLRERDLASFYTDEFLAKWQAPIIQAFKTSDQYIGQFEDLLFRYLERQIYVRRHENQYLCVITLADIDMDGLRMGSRLLLNELVKIPVVVFTPPPVFQPPQVGVFTSPQPRARPAAPPQRATSPPPRRKPPSTSDGIWG
jgi:hypothetical protein